MDIQVSHAGTAATVAFSGSFRIDIAPRVRKALLGAIAKGAKALTIDVRKVDYIDSSTIATFLEVLQKVQGEGGSMRIVGASPRLREIFDLMGLAPLFTFE